MLSVLVILGIGVGYWQSAMRAREWALRAARNACERDDLQSLDESVVLFRTRPARDARGRACWRRRYRFEFSDDGGTRRQGEVELVGTLTVALRLVLADHTLHQIQ